MSRSMGLALLLVVLASVTRLAAAPAEVHVSPGGSDVQGDGSPQKPYLTLERAVSALRAQPAGVVTLASGVHQLLSPTILHVQNPITFRGPAEGEATITQRATDPFDFLLEIQATGSSRPEVRVERLRIVGGLTGLIIQGEDAAGFDAVVEGVSFQGQLYQALEVVAGEGSSARAVVKRNRIDGEAAFGIDLGTRRGASLEVQVEENIVEGPSAPLPAGGSRPLRYGVSLFLDAAVRVRGSIDRNTITNVPAGVLVVQSSVDADLGELDLRISGCLIAGDPSPERNRLRHGFHLDLHPPFRTSLRLLQNTVVNASGHAVHQDEPILFPEDRENLDLWVGGNIFRGMGAKDFGAESDEGALPEHYREVRSNLLSRSSRIGTEGNISGDPRLSPSHRPEAGSPAVDGFSLPAGHSSPLAAAAAELAAGLDLAGSCRVAEGDGDGLYRMDLGAFELSGPCLAGARPFLRSDCDLNQVVEITDPVGLFQHLFVTGGVLSCPDACDADDDGELSITDGIYSLGYLFLGGTAPPAPFGAPGLDPTADRLGLCR